jgi:hypothetical protein
MSPTSSRRFFVGRNARSATLRTTVRAHHRGSPSGGPSRNPGSAQRFRVPPRDAGAASVARRAGVEDEHAHGRRRPAVRGRGGRLRRAGAPGRRRARRLLRGRGRRGRLPRAPAPGPVRAARPRGPQRGRAGRARPRRDGDGPGHARRGGRPVGAGAPGLGRRRRAGGRRDGVRGDLGAGTAGAGRAPALRVARDGGAPRRARRALEGGRGPRRAGARGDRAGPDAEGRFDVRVARRPAVSRVDPETGEVVRAPASGAQ